MEGSEVECVSSSQDGVAHHETIQWKCVRGDKASQPAIIAGSPTVTRKLHCLATRDDFANPAVRLRIPISLEAEGDVGGGTDLADRQPMELNTPSGPSKCG